MQIPWILIGNLSPAEIARALMPPKSNINGLALVVVRYPPLPSPPLFHANAHAPPANSYITATDLVPRRKSGASPSPSSSRVSSCTLDELLISWNFFNPFKVHAEGKLSHLVDRVGFCLLF